MASSVAKIGLSVESCRELFGLTRRVNGTGKRLSDAIFGYFEAFAAAGMQESETAGQLRTTIPCSSATRRRFLKAIEENLGHRPNVEEVLAPLLEGGKLDEDTLAAIRLDVENLTASPKSRQRN